MKIAASGTQGSMNNAMQNLDLEKVPGSKTSLSKTGFAGNNTNTDRNMSQSVPPNDARAD
jgi:hypothetical protein